MKFILFFFIALLPIAGSAQIIRGKVSDRKSENTIPGANVFWEGTTSGTVTDEKGSFELPLDVSLPANLVVSFVGYTADTIKVVSPDDFIEVELSGSLEIETVEVEDERDVHSMSATAKLNAESINRGVLRKAACCNLSESFETTASVDVVLNDAVTGTRKIQMLGLDGIYVQNLFEGIPFNRGLGNVLGFDQIPGPWISSIQLTKGVGTVVNGYESMAGLINLEFLPPDQEERVYADIFANNQGRYEGNLILTKPLSKRISTAVFASGNLQEQKVDQNNDGFLDMPTREGAKFLNRWKYKGDLFRAQLIGSYTYEERTAGQKSFDFGDDFGSEAAYGFGMEVEQIEIMAKSGLLSKKRADRSLGITANYTFTDIQSYFGNERYLGEQVSFRLNSIFESKLSQYSDHSFTAGLHFLYDEFNEALADSSFNRIERVPGAFLEYTYERPRFTAVAGARVDEHNLFGTQFSPRIHLKYNLKPLTTLRATFGRGFRTPNAFADQLGFLASSRVVQVLETPVAEVSYNTGLSFLHKFELFERDAVFNSDYYFTYFTDQLVVDRDFSPQALLFYNLDGESFSHSFQTDFQAEPFEGVGMKMSYKYQWVETDYLEGNLQKPLVPQHRALFNVGYTSPKGKWYLDFTANYYGVSRLPGTSENPAPFDRDNQTEAYFLFNSQITRVLGNFEVYVGSENLGNFIQEDAIIDPANPFGEFFDATMIYGPLNGRTFYAGVRFDLKTKNK